MKYWGTILLLSFGVLAGCSSGSSVECDSNQDCSGDPGTGCRWTCIDNECQPLCEDECQTAEDCADLEWPINCVGVWECNDGECNPVCSGCDSVADCLIGVWEVACVGHWICEVDEQCVGDCAGECVEKCDSLNCGDGICDSSIGEVEDSCPEDCGSGCQVASDCLSLEWLVDCNGHWTCEAGICLEKCDALTCPDGDCDPDLGESGQSCPQDCDMSCITALDCNAHVWPLGCEGHWECRRGQCEAVCGVLPTCTEIKDCLQYPWEARCMGHWACEYNICEVVCNDGCGDGICNPDNGESEESCPPDCGTHCVGEGFPIEGNAQCCPGLERLQEWLPGDINPNPIWFCLACGDQACGPHESAYNCPQDCTIGCSQDEVIYYHCDNGSAVTWCECKEPECVPECLFVGTYSEGWYDSCTDELYRFELCGDCEVECRHPGTESEGWWPLCPNSPVEPELIEYAYCVSFMSCLYDPSEQCY